MIYHVTAKFRDETAAELLSKLSDGTISDQRPDGREIVASLERAVVNEAGKVEWSEMCFCPSPLLHERTTVLDHHFDGIETEAIEAHHEYAGRSFMVYLQGLAGQALSGAKRDDNR